MKEKNAVMVGGVGIGGKSPVSIQSMTNTDTADISKTANQILELAESGAEIVRVTIDRPESARAIPRIRDLVRAKSNVPIVGDFHFSGHLLLRRFPEMASALDKYRINPGNLGAKNRDLHFESILEIAARNNTPIRIGGNGGSIDPALLAEKTAFFPSAPMHDILREALVDSVLRSERFALRFLPPEKIILSAKCSDFSDTIFVYKKIAQKSTAPLHIGLTEAGGGISGIVKSTAALSVLLASGIGDTIRVSITPRKNESRTREVEVAREILQSLDLRQFFPEIISCPGCGRTHSYFFSFSEDLSSKLRSVDFLYRFPFVSTWKIAIMGCVVNGPGEAQNADLGIFFPGRNEQKVSLFFRGQKQGDYEHKKVFETLCSLLTVIDTGASNLPQKSEHSLTPTHRD